MRHLASLSGHTDSYRRVLELHERLTTLYATLTSLVTITTLTGASETQTDLHTTRHPLPPPLPASAPAQSRLTNT